jgi:hypothetical protein
MKIKEEMIKGIKSAQNSMEAIQRELGSLPLREVQLLKAYAEQQAQAQAVTDAICEEYGDGVLDLETFDFTSNKEQL